jgi:hypothetical protein
MLLRAEHLIVGLAVALAGIACDRSECDSTKQAVEPIGHTLDELGCARILVEAVPDQPAWSAIADRLRRAAA